MMTSLSKYSRRALRFGRDEDGISAVEFALVAPFMALLYFGCIELSLMMQTDRRVTSAASTMGDLVARASTLTDDDIEEVFQASRMIMEPSPMANARLRISSLVSEDGSITVDWSDANENWTARSVGEAVTVPDNLVPDGGSVIFAEVEFDYSSQIGYFIDNTRTLTDEFYLRPRRVNVVERNDDD